MTRGDTRSALRAFGKGVGALLALRWVRALLVLAFLVLVARLALGRVLWSAVDRAAASRGLACSFDDLDLRLLSGRAEVTWLELRPRDAAQESAPLLAVEYGVFDLELVPLLWGDLKIRRGELDGIDVLLERGSDGRWSAARYLQAAAEPAPEESEREPRAPPADWRYDLAPPFAADALRLQHARLHLVDHAVVPPVDLTVEMSLRLSSLGTPGRPTRFSASASGGDLFDGATIEGEASSTSDALRLSLRAQAGSIRLARLAPYLLAVDLAPACDSLSAGLSAELELAVIGAEHQALSGSLELTRVQLGADGKESLALDRLRAGVASFSPERAELSGIEIEGLRARASREPSGALRAGGLDFLPAEPSAGPPEPWTRPIEDTLALLRPAALPRWARLLGERDPQAYPWSLGSLVLIGGKIDFSDGSVEPRADLELLVDRAALGEVVHDPAAEARAIAFEATLRSPGAAESIRLEGSLRPFAPARSIDVTLAVDGIALAPVEGRLRTAGFSSALENGAFHLHLTGAASTDAGGRTEGWLELDQMELSADEELAGVRSVSARGLVYDPSVPLLRAGEVEIEGPRLALVRDASRQLVLFGLRTLGFTPPSSSDATRAGEAPPIDARPLATGASAAPRAREPAAPLPPVLFELGKLAWKNSRVEVTDRLVDPPRRFVLGDLTFVIEDLALGGDPARPTPEPARFSARLSSEELVDELSAEGTVRSRPGRALDLTAELALRGRGLRGKLLAPYLRQFGIEPLLEDAELALDLAAGLREEEGWRAELALRDASLVQDGATLFSLGELRLSDVRLGDTLELGELALVRPFATSELDAEGVASIAGWRLVGAPVEASAPDGDVRDTRAPPALPELARLLVHKLAIEEGRIAWRTPSLAAELLLDLEGSELGTLGLPGRLAARLSVPGAVDRLELETRLALGREEIALSGALAANGIRAGPLAALWPAGVDAEPGGARIALELDAALRPAEPAGLAAQIALRRLSAGAVAAEPSFSVDEAALEIERLDRAAGVLELGEARLAGASLDARRDAAGGWHALGLHLRPADESALAAETAATSETQAPAAHEAFPELAQAPGNERGAPPGSSMRRVALAQGLALEVARLRIVDETLGPGARPLAGRVELELDGPAVIFDRDASEPAALSGRIAGALDGVVREWSIAGSANLYAPEPTLELALHASGVSTAGLCELLPGLATSGDVEEGVLEARLASTFFVRRGRPSELGLGRPFGADLVLDGLAFRDGAGGALIAGVERITADVERVDAAAGLVHVKRLELERLGGVVGHGAGEWHVLGLRFGKDAGEPPEPAPAAPARVAIEAEAPLERAAPPPPTAALATEEETSPGELRIDELVACGIAVEWREGAADPPLVIPLTDFDFEVKRFTTRAFREELPVQFSGLLRAGEAPPPADGQRGGRRTFDAIETAGRLVFHPATAGWWQVSLDGLELTRFAGLTEGSGLKLDDGAFDASARMRFDGKGNARIDSSLVFTDLDLKEPEGGPLERLLSLPVSLDTALVLLRNQDGEHRFSLGFPLEKGGVSTGALVAAGASAFAELLARALAAMPLRVLGTLVPIEQDEKPGRSWTLAFAPGSTELSAEAEAVLADLRLELGRHSGRSLRLVHELGAEDAAHAERLANPSPERCLELAARLRQRRADSRAARTSSWARRARATRSARTRPPKRRRRCAPSSASSRTRSAPSTACSRSCARTRRASATSARARRCGRSRKRGSPPPRPRCARASRELSATRWRWSRRATTSCRAPPAACGSTCARRIDLH